MSRNQPNRHTCPDIDRCIKWIRDAQQSIERAITNINDIEFKLDGEALDSVYALINDSLNALNDAHSRIEFTGELEDLRLSNSELREWGYELRSELEKIENQI